MAAAESYAPQGRSGVPTSVLSLSVGDLDLAVSRSEIAALGCGGRRYRSNAASI